MKQLTLPHAKAAYRCPVNGLSDIYQWKTGQRIPEALIFDSRIGYGLTLNPTGIPSRMIRLGEGGIGKVAYEFWREKIGYAMTDGEGAPFEDALQQVCALIDRETPVLLFGLDMYHLPYHARFYRKLHVPGHINLMIGYDDDCVYVHDNDRDGVHTLPFADLEKAWCTGAGDGRRNVYFGIDMHAPNPSVREIVNMGLTQTAAEYLSPVDDNAGAPGLARLIEMLPRWPAELPPEDLRSILSYFTMFTASTVPEQPRKLRGYDSGMHNPHRGCRDTFAAALVQHAQAYGTEQWTKAAACFARSGEVIERLTDCFAEVILTGDGDLLATCTDDLRDILRIESEGFRLLA